MSNERPHKSCLHARADWAAELSHKPVIELLRLPIGRHETPPGEMFAVAPELGTQRQYAAGKGATRPARR